MYLWNATLLSLHRQRIREEAQARDGLSRQFRNLSRKIGNPSLTVNIISTLDLNKS